MMLAPRNLLRFLRILFKITNAAGNLCAVPAVLNFLLIIYGCDAVRGRAAPRNA